MSEHKEVGCRQCGKGGQWKVFSDGKKIVMYQCNNCKHIIDVAGLEIKEKPDDQVYQLRFFT